MVRREFRGVNAIYDFLNRLATDGNKVDLVEPWNGEMYGDFESIPVNLAEVAREKFQFIEIRKLVLTPSRVTLIDSLTPQKSNRLPKEVTHNVFTRHEARIRWLSRLGI